MESRLCYDLAPLRHAADKVFGDDPAFLEELGDIIDAASSGKWTGSDEDCDDYVFGADGWRMVRERGEEVDE